MSACAATLPFKNVTRKKTAIDKAWTFDLAVKMGVAQSDGDHKYLGQSGRLIFDHICLIVIHSAS